MAENPACNPACRVCHYKRLDYPSQLQRKQAWAQDQLQTWKDVLKNILPSPEADQLGYRSKSWLRSSLEGGALSFGMYRSIRIEGGGWGKEFISWDTCPLHFPPMQQMLEKIGEVFANQAPALVEENLVGIWIGSPHVVIISRDPSSEEVRQLDWAKIVVSPFNRVWFHCNPQVGRKVFGHRKIESIYDSARDVEASTENGVHPIRAFRQVAQSLLSEARALAVQALLEKNPALVLDLYCGTGDLSLLLPQQTGWLGIEMSQDAVKYANGLRKPETAPHEAFVGAVEQRLRDPRVWDKISPPYALYLNPPRSGLTEDAREQVVALIRKKPPTCIVYLSCSASSLARDLAVFEKEGYRVDLLQPFDFFPQTEHFETLAILKIE